MYLDCETKHLFCQNESTCANYIATNFNVQINDSTFVLSDINELHIDDIIYVNYLPSSLKHLYELFSECGKIIDIKTSKDVFNNKFTDIIILNHNNEITSIFKYWLGDYSPNYDVLIRKKI